MKREDRDPSRCNPVGVVSATGSADAFRLEDLDARWCARVCDKRKGGRPPVIAAPPHELRPRHRHVAAGLRARILRKRPTIPNRPTEDPPASGDNSPRSTPDLSELQWKYA